MQDVSIDDLAEEIRDALVEQGVEMSRSDVRTLVREFLYGVEDVLTNQKEVRFSMYNRGLAHVFWPLEKKKLCNEFANGVGVSVDHLLKKNKLSKAARKHLRFRMGTTMPENALD